MMIELAKKGKNTSMQSIRNRAGGTGVKGLLQESRNGLKRELAVIER